jgi:hypothetical protein
VHEHEQSASEFAPLLPAGTTPRLYRHALESIFSFCSLSDLAPLLGVSKNWSTALNSMRPLDAEIDANLPDASFELLYTSESPLIRHVSCLTWHASSLTVQRLADLSARLTNLRSLECSFAADGPAVVFPPRSRILALHFEPLESASAHQLDPAIVGISAQLPWRWSH